MGEFIFDIQLFDGPGGSPPDGGGDPGGGDPGGGDSSGGGGSSSSSVSWTGATEITSADTQSNQTYTSSTADQNALLINTDADVVISNPTVEKSGDSDGGDNCNFYGVNSGIMAMGGGATTITGGTVTASATGANGVFSYGGNGGTNGAAGDGTTVYVSDMTINTTGSNSGGIMTTGGGKTVARNLTITTQGGSSAPIRTDRGGGDVTVEGGSYTSNGLGSPAIYSTADIIVSDATLTSNLSEGVCIEGQNSVALNNCTLTANNTQTNGNATFLDTIMIYQSQSGDAADGTSTFTMTDGVLNSQSGHVFHVTNTSAIITLSNVTINNASSDGVLLSVCDDGWSGASNVATLNASNQTLNGDILVGSDSTLTMSLTGSTLRGAVSGSITNASGSTVSSTVGTVNVSLDDNSKWYLTGDASITTFDGDAANVINNGFTLYVNGTALDGTTDTDDADADADADTDTDSDSDDTTSTVEEDTTSTVSDDTTSTAGDDTTTSEEGDADADADSDGDSDADSDADDTTSTAPVDDTTSAAPVDDTTSTAPVDDTTSTAPFDDTTSTAPVDDTTSTAPVDDTTSTAPVDDTTSTAPVDDTTSAAPVDDTTSTAPVDDTTSTAPVDDTTSTAPVDDTTSAAPVDDTTSTAPVDDTTSTAPVDDTTSTAPVDDTTSTAPVDDTTSAAPVDDTTSTAPVDDTTSTAPVDDTTSAAPVDDTTSTAPVDDTTSTAPVDDTTSTAPVDDTTSTAPVDDTTSTAPVDDTTSTAPVDDTTSTAPVDDTTTIISPTDIVDEIIENDPTEYQSSTVDTSNGTVDASTIPNNAAVELNDNAVLDMSESDAKIKLTLIDGDQQVTLSNAGGSTAHIDVAATGSKIINAGPRGDRLVNESALANVTMTGGAGDDTIVARGSSNELIDLSNGGVDKIYVPDGATISGYNAETGAAFITDIDNVYDAIIDGSLTFDNGSFEMSGVPGEIVLDQNPSTSGYSAINITDTNGRTLRVMSAHSAGGNLNGSNYDDDAIFLGNKEGGSTLVGGSGDDTFIAGANDQIVTGSGSNAINLQNSNTGGAFIDQTNIGDVEATNNISGYDSQKNFIKMNASDFFNNEASFADDIFTVKRGNTTNNYILDGTSSLNDVDDIINTPLDSIINSEDAAFDIDSDDAQSLLQSGNALADGNSKFNNQAVNQKQYNQK